MTKSSRKRSGVHQGETERDVSRILGNAESTRCRRQLPTVIVLKGVVGFGNDEIHASALGGVAPTKGWLPAHSTWLRRSDVTWPRMS
jgi:hypothetical protein